MAWPQWPQWPIITLFLSCLNKNCQSYCNTVWLIPLPRASVSTLHILNKLGVTQGSEWLVIPERFHDSISTFAKKEYPVRIAATLPIQTGSEIIKNEAVYTVQLELLNIIALRCDMSMTPDWMSSTPITYGISVLTMQYNNRHNEY